MHIRPPNKNRNNRNKNGRKPMGNVQNRVYESAGPEGKVRGTPQQIIEKYMLLARDAQTSGDRVIAENFLQHAEHYIRLLNASQPPGEERRPAQNFGMQSRADYDDIEDQEEDAAAEAEERATEERAAEARNGDGRNAEGRSAEGRNAEPREGGRGERRERRPDERRNDERRAENRRGEDAPGEDPREVEQPPEVEAAPAVERSGSGLETIDADAEAGVGLVPTPESREAEPEKREAAPRRRRRRPAAAEGEAAVVETVAES